MSKTEVRKAAIGGGAASQAHRGALAAGLGALLALPAILLAAPVVWEADSSRLIASTGFVRAHGIDYLIETQEVWMPHVILSPTLALGGIRAATLLTALTLVGLAASVAYITYKLTNSVSGAAASALALVGLDAITSQVHSLPMYLPMLAFGYLGMYLAWRSLEASGAKRWKLAALGTLALIASSESHGVGQIFLAAPVLLLAIKPDWVGLLGVVRLGLLEGLFFIPRVVVNLVEGGLSFFRSNRVDYFITEGYLNLINREFHGLPVSAGPLDYLGELPSMAVGALDTGGFMVLAVVGAGILFARKRWVTMSLVSLIALLVSLLIVTPPTFARYLTPVLPGMAIVAGAVVASMNRKGWRPVAGAALMVLAIAGGVTFLEAWGHSRAQTDAVRSGPVPAIASQVPQGGRVLGVRSHQLNYVRPDIEPYGGLFLGESEYVAYLTWSQEDVKDLLRARDIGWVFLLPDETLEVRYHQIWISEVYGTAVRHYYQVPKAPFLCLTAEHSGYRLYRAQANGC